MVGLLLYLNIVFLIPAVPHAQKIKEEVAAINTRAFLRVSVFFLLCTSLAGALHAEGAEEMPLWPEIEPYKTDYLKVSDIHELYYELCGNPEGIPVFVLHGGPGSGSSPFMRRFFNPEKYLIVLHDQRGAGKSKPYADIRDNTTQHLVEDIEQLRNHLGLDNVILFGGSWGTTLGLAYAEAYPAHVSGLVLRGVFTAMQEEIDHFYHGGVRKFFPEIYGDFLSELPQPDEKPLPPHLLDLIQSNSTEERDKFSLLWAMYEVRICALDMSEQQVKDIRKYFKEDHSPYAFALLENYYMTYNCFLEEGQLLRDTDKIQHIPAVIVNGRYDMVCPPVTAYRLHKRLPKSKLIIAESAGHWMGEAPIQQALLQAMRDFEDGAIEFD
jgi:proline iminopeptidase